MILPYALIARFIVLALVLLYTASPRHSSRSRLLVAGAYIFTLALARFIPSFSLATLVLQVALGITLLVARRWERGAEASF